MSNITVIKGKLLKETVEVHFIDRKTDGKGTLGGEFDMPPHKDLVAAFKKLTGHAAVLGEFIPSSSINDEEQLEKFVVKGFTIKGGEDMNGVVLAAQKILSTGKVLGFNTPLIAFNEEGENPYEHLTELFEAIEECKRELKSYLGGKHGDKAQQEIEFPEAGNNGAVTTDELGEGETNDAMENVRIASGDPGAAAKKRGRKPKVVETEI